MPRDGQIVARHIVHELVREFFNKRDTQKKLYTESLGVENSQYHWRKYGFSGHCPGNCEVHELWTLEVPGQMSSPDKNKKLKTSTFLNPRSGCTPRHNLPCNSLNKTERMETTFKEIIHERIRSRTGLAPVVW